MTIVEELRTNRESGAKRLEVEYKGGLMTLARRFCADEGDAEELVNRTFVAVVEGIDDYLEQSAFFGWMCQILSNIHAKDIRRKSHGIVVCPGDVPDVIDENAEGRIFQEIDASLLHDAIENLPQEMQEAVVLHYFTGLSVQKIAKFLAIPEGTVKSRLHYARLALGAKLGANMRKPGGRAVLVALALCGLTALGAGIYSLASGGDASTKRPQDDAAAGRIVDASLPDPSDSPDSSGMTGWLGMTGWTGDLQPSNLDLQPPATDNFQLSTFQLSTSQGETMNLTTTTRAAALLAAATFAAFPASAGETIAYWPFGTNGFHDVSGNGHDLTSTTVTESDAGYITLDGTSQFLTTASALDLSGEAAVTFECWTRSTGKKGNGILFSTTSPSRTSAGSFVMYYTGRLQSQLGMGTNWQIDYTDSTAAMDDGAWHHVAYVIDPSQTGEDATRLYLDGIQMKNAGGQTGAVPALLNQVLHIGGGSAYSSGSNFFTGFIDDVRISRGALPPDQFLKYPTVGKAMNAESSDLPVVAYWPFGGKGGKDATGNGFDLTMNGVPMTSGTPSPDYNNYAKTNYYNGNFPFSAFSKTGLTLECFAKTDSSGGGMAGSLLETTTAYYNNTGAFQLRFEASSSYKTATAYFLASGKSGSNPKYIQSPTTEELFGALNDGKWRHYAIVYDPSKTGSGIVTFYVDGVAAPTTADNADQSAFALLDAKLYLARRDIASGTGSAPFYGSIDDVRITAGALTPDQFLPARSAGSTVALYRFDRETLEDLSGNGNALVNEGNATFGDGGHAASGTGIVLDGSTQWLHTLNGIDLSHTKAATIEFDYQTGWPGGWGTGTKICPFVATEDVDAVGGLTIYNPGSAIQAQWRAVASGAWRTDKSADFSNGYHEGRYTMDISASPQTALFVDGAKASVAQDNTVSLANLGSQVLHFGHGPNYVSERYLKGKFCRIAISDVALAQGDFVLDNLVDPEAKRTLAYWNFSGSEDKSGNGHDLAESGTSRRNGAIVLDGSASVATVNTLNLSGLTQATIECFVLFGGTPASGTLFGMGSGAGSFAVAADATAGTLSGSFMPYDHLAASNGGSTALAPLAGKKTWHHVALVIDRTQPGADAVRFYVDYARATPAGRAWDAAARMLDGTLSVGTGFTGRIDDLRVSAGALAPDEFIQPAARTESADAFTMVIR